MRALLVIVVLVLGAIAAWFTRDLWLPQPPVKDTTSTAAAGAASGGGARSTAPGPAARPLPVPTASSELQVREQAERYVATLTEPEQEPVRVERADHFVTGDQMLDLIPDAAVQTTTLAAMRNDPALGPDTPITVVRHVEQVERVTPEKLIARSGGDMSARVRVLVNEEVRETTVGQLLEDLSRSPERPIDVLTRSDYYEQTTPRELAQRTDLAPDSTIEIVRGHRGLEAASVQQLVRGRPGDEDALYYVRTVRPDDTQGIWGIVHDGIIQNFARGMAIRRGRELNTYQVEIPRNADERLADASSSFLGKLIHQKTTASHVYNFTQNRMGRNPDRIKPGQEIVIIRFQPGELIDIYEHFVAQRG